MVLTRIADPDVLVESGFFLSVGSCFEKSIYYLSVFSRRSNPFSCMSDPQPWPPIITSSL